MNTNFANNDFKVIITLFVILIFVLLYISFRNSPRVNSLRPSLNAFDELNTRSLAAVSILETRLIDITTFIYDKRIDSYDDVSKMLNDCYTQWKKQYSHLFTVVPARITITKSAPSVYLFEIPRSLQLYKSHFESSSK